MKSQTQLNPLVAIPLLVIFACSHPDRQPGICLSFDDRSVLEWNEMRPLLNSYNAHVTFFVTQFDSLNNNEIKILKQLEADGHEIGSHGALHVLSETYIKDHSYKEWLTKEIDADITTLKANGFNPISFAYPYGSKYWFTDALLRQRFKIVRSVAAYSEPIENIDEIFYDFNNDRTLSALGCDRNSGVTIEKLEKALDRAVQDQEVLMLYAHVPGNGTGDYSFDMTLLEELLESASKKGLVFYTFKDLVNVD